LLNANLTHIAHADVIARRHRQKRTQEPWSVGDDQLDYCPWPVTRWRLMRNK